MGHSPVAMLTVHHLERSRSHRVLWLLEELELSYELKRYSRHPRTWLAPDDLKRIHPLGKSPILTDGDRVVVESAAILEYLLDAHGDGRLRPAPGTDAALAYRYWLHYAEGSLMPPLLVALIFSRVPSGAPWPLRPVARAIERSVRRRFTQPQLETHLSHVDRSLTDREWLTGSELSAADIQMSYPLLAAERRSGLESYPNIAAFLDRVRARPAYQRAIDRGGPVML